MANVTSKNRQTNDERLTSLRKRLDALRHQESMLENTLLSHNFIVTIGAYTVGKDDKGLLSLDLTDHPSRWNERGVKEILEKHNCKRKNGDRVEPKVFTTNEWLSDKISSIEQTIELLTETKAGS